MELILFILGCIVTHLYYKKSLADQKNQATEIRKQYDDLKMQYDDLKKQNEELKQEIFGLRKDMPKYGGISF